MATRQQNLTAAADYIAARIAELDTVPVSERARMTYTAPNGQSFGWNEYRASLTAQYKAITDAGPGGSSPEQQAGGPFEVHC